MADGNCVRRGYPSSSIGNRNALFILLLLVHTSAAMGNLQSSTAAAGSDGAKSRNKKPTAAGAREWLMGGATRALRKPVAPAAPMAAAAAATDHVTVTSRRDLLHHFVRRSWPSVPSAAAAAARDHDTTADHADEQQRRTRQERRRNDTRDGYSRTGISSSSSVEEDEDSAVFADTLTSPQSVYSDARDEPYDMVVVNGGDTLNGGGGGGGGHHHHHHHHRAAAAAFTVVKHRKVELNPARIQSAATVANGGKSLESLRSLVIRVVRSVSTQVGFCFSKHNICHYLSFYHWHIRITGAYNLCFLSFLNRGDKLEYESMKLNAKNN